MSEYSKPKNDTLGTLLLCPVTIDEETERHLGKDRIGGSSDVPVHFLYAMTILIERTLIEKNDTLDSLLKALKSVSCVWAVKHIPDLPILQVYFDPFATLGDRNNVPDFWDMIRDCLLEAGYWIDHRSYTHRSRSAGGHPSEWRKHIEDINDKERSRCQDAPFIQNVD